MIWIHAVSLGEMRASFPIYEALRARSPKTQFYFSSSTQTGFDAAQAMMKDAEVFFLPLDFSWIMKNLVKKLNPDLVIFMEGDLWFNLLKALKKQKIPSIICSAKISEKSFHRFLWVKGFAKKLFSLPDKILVQQPLFVPYFEKLGTPKENLHVIGNIKESFIPAGSEKDQADILKERFFLDSKDFLIVLGSTHEGEEAQLAGALKPLLQEFPAIRLLFVPRHPERFAKVQDLLFSLFDSVTVFSSPGHKSRVMLLDRTGMLCACFSLAKLAILGGSFVDGIGGHNILEPVMRETPVLFGPYMYDQKGFVEKALAMDVGEQVPISEMREKVAFLLKNSKRLLELKKNSLKLQKEAGLPLQKALGLLDQYLR